MDKKKGFHTREEKGVIEINIFEVNNHFTSTQLVELIN